MKKTTFLLVNLSLFAILSSGLSSCGKKDEVKSEADIYDIFYQSINDFLNYDNNSYYYMETVVSEEDAKINVEKTSFDKMEGITFVNEEEKQQFIDDFNAELDENLNTRDETITYYSFDSDNSVAYEAEYYLGLENMWLGTLYLTAKEDDKYYYYDMDDMKRYLVGPDHFESYFRDIKMNYELFFHSYYCQDNLEKEETFLADYYGQETNYVYQKEILKNDQFYEIKWTLTHDFILDEESFLLEYLGDYLDGYNKEIISFKFNDDGLISSSYENASIMNFSYSLEDSPDDKVIITDKSSYGYEMEFNKEYNDAKLPTIDKSAYSDSGNISISVDYYIDGLMLLGAIETHYFTEDVKLFAPENQRLYANMIKEDAIWYLDEECTIPFTLETFPSCDLELYTTMSSIEEGYAFVAVAAFSSIEQYENAKNNGRINYYYHLRTVNYEEVTSAYQCVFLNGTRLEVGDKIQYREKAYNEHINIYKV